MSDSQALSFGTALAKAAFQSELAEFFPAADAANKNLWATALYAKSNVILTPVAGCPVDLLNRLAALYPGYTLQPSPNAYVVGHALARVACYLATRLLTEEYQKFLIDDDFNRVILVAPSTSVFDKLVSWCVANGKTIDIDVIQPILDYDLTRVLRKSKTLNGYLGRDGASQCWRSPDDSIHVRVTRKKFQEYSLSDWHADFYAGTCDFDLRYSRVALVIAPMSAYYFNRHDYSRVMASQPHAVGLFTLHVPRELDVTYFSMERAGPNTEVRSFYNRPEGYGCKLFWDNGTPKAAAYYADEENTTEKPYICNIEDWLSWYDNVLPGSPHLVQMKQAGQDSCRLIIVERAVGIVTCPSLFNGGSYMLVPNLYSVAKGLPATRDMLALPSEVFNRLVREIHSRDVTALFKEYAANLTVPGYRWRGAAVSTLSIFLAMLDANSATNLRTSIVRIIGGRVVQSIAGMLPWERDVLQAYLVYHSAILPHARSTLMGDALRVRTRYRAISNLKNFAGRIVDHLTLGYKWNHDPLRDGTFITYDEYRSSRMRGNFDSKSNFFMAVHFDPRRMASTNGSWTLSELLLLSEPPPSSDAHSSILGHCWDSASSFLLQTSSLAPDCAFRRPDSGGSYLVYCEGKLVVCRTSNRLFDQDVPMFNFVRSGSSWHVSGHIVRVAGPLGPNPIDRLRHDPVALRGHLLRGVPMPKPDFSGGFVVEVTPVKTGHGVCGEFDDATTVGPADSEDEALSDVDQPDAPALAHSESLSPHRPNFSVVLSTFDLDSFDEPADIDTLQVVVNSAALDEHSMVKEGRAVTAELYDSLGMLKDRIGRFREHPASEYAYQERVKFLKTTEPISSTLPSNAARKLHQILHDYADLIVPGALFLDICAGPGAMSRYLLRDSTARGYGITLEGGRDTAWYDELRNHPQYVIADEKEGCRSGNIYGTSVVDYLCGDVLPGKVDLVIADGGFETADDRSSLRELYYCRLIFSEVYIALRTLKGNGNLLLKTFDTVSIFMSQLLFVLSHCFEHLEFVKPASSAPSSSEKYLVARGYRDDDFCQEAVVKFKGYHGVLARQGISQNNFTCPSQLVECDSDYDHFVDNLCVVNDRFLSARAEHLRALIEHVEVAVGSGPSRVSPTEGPVDPPSRTDPPVAAAPSQPPVAVASSPPAAVVLLTSATQDPPVVKLSRRQLKKLTSAVTPATSAYSTLADDEPSSSSQPPKKAKNQKQSANYDVLPDDVGALPLRELKADRKLDAVSSARLYQANNCITGVAGKIVSPDLDYSDCSAVRTIMLSDWRQGLLTRDHAVFMRAVANSIADKKADESDVKLGSLWVDLKIKTYSVNPNPAGRPLTNDSGNRARPRYASAYLEIMQKESLRFIVFYEPLVQEITQALQHMSCNYPDVFSRKKIVILSEDCVLSYPNLLVTSPAMPGLLERIACFEHVGVITGKPDTFRNGVANLPTTSARRIYLGPWPLDTSMMGSYCPSGLSGTGHYGLLLDEIGTSPAPVSWVDQRAQKFAREPIDLDAALEEVAGNLARLNAVVSKRSRYDVTPTILERVMAYRRDHNADPSNAHQQLPGFEAAPGRRRVILVDGVPRSGKSVTLSVASGKTGAVILAPTDALVAAHTANGYRAVTFIVGQKQIVGKPLVLIDEYQLWPPTLLEFTICAAAQDAVIILVGNHEQPNQFVEKRSFTGPFSTTYRLSETRALGPLHVALMSNFFEGITCSAMSSRFYAQSEELYIVRQDEGQYSDFKSSQPTMRFIELTRSTVDAANSTHTLTGTESTGSGFRDLYCFRVDARSKAMHNKGDPKSWMRQVAVGCTRGNKTILSLDKEALVLFAAYVDPSVLANVHDFDHRTFQQALAAGELPTVPCKGVPCRRVVGVAREGQKSMHGYKYKFTRDVGACVQLEEFNTATVSKSESTYVALVRGPTGLKKASVTVGQAHLSPVGDCVTGPMNLKEVFIGSARKKGNADFAKTLQAMGELVNEIGLPKELQTVDPIVPEAIATHLESQLITCRLGVDAAAGKLTENMRSTRPVLEACCLTDHPTSSYQQNNLSFSWKTAVTRAAYINDTGAKQIGMYTPVSSAEQEKIGEHLVDCILRDYKTVARDVRALKERYQDLDDVAELLANHEKAALVKMIVKGTSADENRVIVISDREAVEDLKGPTTGLASDETEIGAGLGRYDPERLEQLRCADGLAKSQMKDASTYSADSTGRAYIPSRDDKDGQPVFSVNPARSKTAGYACGVVRACFALAGDALQSVVSLSASPGHSVESAATAFYANLERNRAAAAFRFIEADESHKDSNYCRLVLSSVAHFIRKISPALAEMLMEILNPDFDLGWTISMNKGFLSLIVRSKTGSGAEYTLDLNSLTTLLLAFLMCNHRFHKTRQAGPGALIGSWWVQDLGPMIFALLAQGDDITIAIKAKHDIDDTFTKQLRILHKIIKHEPGSYVMMYCNHICNYHEGVTYVGPHFVRAAVRLYNRLYHPDMVQAQVAAIAASVRDRLRFGNGLDHNEQIQLSARYFGLEHTLVAYHFLSSFASSAPQFIVPHITSNRISLTTSDAGFTA